MDSMTQLESSAFDRMRGVLALVMVTSFVIALLAPGSGFAVVSTLPLALWLGIGLHAHIRGDESGIHGALWPGSNTPYGEISGWTIRRTKLWRWIPRVSADPTLHLVLWLREPSKPAQVRIFLGGATPQEALEVPIDPQQAEAIAAVLRQHHVPERA